MPRSLKRRNIATIQEENKWPVCLTKLKERSTIYSRRVSATRLIAIYYIARSAIMPCIMRSAHLRGIAFLALGFLAMPNQLAGQTAFGLKFGVNRTSQHEDFANVPGLLEPRTGFDLGVFAEWFDNPWIRLNTEIHFVRKATGYPDMPITTTESPDGTGEFVKISYAFDFISVSILPKIRTTFGPVEVYGLFGPRVDISVHREANVESPERYQSVLQQSYDSHLTHFRDAEVGGDFAIGSQLGGLVFSGIGLEVRYSPDFMASYDVPGGTITNHSWAFFLTVSL